MLPKLESIKHLLLREWDPIGIQDAEAARDEYDEYALWIFGMLGRGTDEETIARYLDRAESEQMMLTLHADRNREIARKAIDIYMG